MLHSVTYSGFVPRDDKLGVPRLHHRAVHESLALGLRQHEACPLAVRRVALVVPEIELAQIKDADVHG